MAKEINIYAGNGELPDIIADGLNILFVGYNPGIESARAGHHYASKSNRFWKLLYDSTLIPVRLPAEEDYRLLEFGYGSTNIVQRPSKSSVEISRSEFTEGSKILESLIRRIMPRIVCYVGIGVYKAFASCILNTPVSGLKVVTGIQEKSLIEGVTDFVCSNPSGLNTIPYSSQVDCFRELKKLL